MAEQPRAGDKEEERAWALELARGILGVRAPGVATAQPDPEPGPEPWDAEALLRGDAERVWIVAPLPVRAEDATMGEAVGDNLTMSETTMEEGER